MRSFWERAFLPVVGVLFASMCLASPALAQVTVNTIAVPSTIGRLMTATIAVDYTRSTSAAATISVPIPSQLAVNPPAVPAGCVVTAPQTVECEVPAGGPGDTGTIEFQVLGQSIGAFNMTATGTGGSNASNPGAVRPSGDLTISKTRTSPAANPIAGQTITFRLTPNTAATGDDVLAGATITLVDQLPGVASDFTVTRITVTPAAAASCNAAAAATTARQVICTFNAPLTAAAFNAVTVDISGNSASNGSFQNNATIATSMSASAPYVDRNPNNNTASLPYTVAPGTDLVAGGSFPGASVVSTTRTLTMTFTNAGPSNVPAGGTVVGQLPAGFTPGTLPGACTASGQLVTCSVPAVATGSSQAFAIPVLTPATPALGNFTVTVAPPAAFGDGNPANNVFLIPFAVREPSGDLSLAKSKTNGPLAPGSTITSNITVTNADISTVTFTAGAGAQPLRVIDDMANDEIYVGVSAGWTCTDLPNTPSASQHRVSCTRDNAGTLAPAAALTLAITSRVNPLLTAPTTLTNTACSGSQALARSGVPDSEGPQPRDTSGANDCVSRGVIGTTVISSNAQVSIVKESSNDGSNWVDSTSTPPTIAGASDFAWWRIVIATPSMATNPSQTVIPTLHLTDNLPGILNLAASGATPAHVTPPVTLTTVITTTGAPPGATTNCPATLTAGSGALSCDFFSVEPGTTMTMVIQVKRPFTGGVLTNTASLSSPNAILAGTVQDQAALSVVRRADPAVASKTITPVDSPTAPRVGQTVTFTVTMRNNGVDSLPAGVLTMADTLDTAKYQVLSVAGSTGIQCTVPTPGAVSCTNTAAIARAQAFTAIITAQLIKPAVLPPSGNVYSNEVNTATVAVSPASICEWRDTAPVSTACGDAAAVSNNVGTVAYDIKLPLIDIQQRKVRQLPAGQAAFGFGDALTYRMRVQNIGPSRAENVIMTDFLAVPAGFVPGTVTVSGINGTAAETGFVLDTTKAASVSCTLSGTTAIACRLSSTPAANYLDANREVNFLLSTQFTGSAPGAASFGNQAVSCADETVAYESVGACSTSTTAGPTGANNNVASANDIVFPKAELGIAKQTLTPSPVAVNQPVQWLLTVRNNGASPIPQIRVTDSLPPNFEYITSTLALGPVAQGAMTGANLACVPTPASITGAGQAQTIACQLDAVGGTGAFPGSTAADNTLTIAISARPKLPYFSGPFLSDLINTATVAPGKDASNLDLAIDTISSNNTATAVIQVQRTSISGRVWADSNLNRAPDGGEPGQAGVPVTLAGTDLLGNSLTLTVNTGVNGSYTFEVPPGSYTITKGADPAGLADYTSNVPGTVPFGTTGAPVSAGVAATTASGSPTSASLISGIQLAPGDVATNYNFGEIAFGASIAGKVFVDANDDGLFNGADVSIPGVTVTLSGFDASSNPVTRTAVTDASGNYLFSGLLPGTYDVTEPAQPATATGATLPAGFSATLPGKTTAGTGVTGNGTATPVATLPSRISGIQLGTGQSSVNNWFGELLPSSIAGRVFLDPNDDGLFNAGDSALAGVTINLTGTDDLGQSVSLSTTTSGSGTYSFGNLRPGTYTLTEPQQPAATRNGKTVAGVVPGGTPGTATAPATLPSRIANIVLPRGTASTGNDFAELRALDAAVTQLGGRVWLDANNNGVVDAGEPGIDGVVIQLSGTATADGIALTRTAVTSGGGNYLFTALPAGTYRVVEPQQPATANGASLPAGLTQTLPGLTVPGQGASQQGSATPPATAPSAIVGVVLLDGNASLNNNFGELAPSQLSGFVYFDGNRNGVRDAGEAGIGEVTVTLTGTDDLGQPVNRSVTTDAGGAYRFTDLRPGTYSMTEPVQPPGTENAETNPGTVGNGGTAGTATPRTTVPSAITGIRIVAAGTNSPDNNFGESGSSPDLVVTKVARTAFFTENNTGVYELSVRNAGPLPTLGDYAVYDVLPRTSPQVWRIESAAGDGWSCSIAADSLSLACRSAAVLAPGALHPGKVIVSVAVLEGAKAFAPLRNFTLVRGGGETPALDPVPGKPVDPGNPGSPSDGDLRNLVPSAPLCVDVPAQASQNFCVRETPVRFSVALGGRVWLDGTGPKNTYDPGDKNYGNWRVLVVDPELLDPNVPGIPPGAIVRTGTTGPDGSYRINNLVPGKTLHVYFQDPDGRTIFAGPVNGDRRVPQACGRSATGSDQPSRNPYLVVNMLEGSFSNELTCPEQSLPIDPNGVVYDSQSREPVPGAVVTFRPEGSCPGYVPSQHNVGYNQYSSFDAAGNPQMTTAGDGFYKFILAASAPASCLFALDVTPPPQYTFPSAVIPPSGTLQTPSGAGNVFNVQPQPLAPVGSENTTYYLVIRSGASHNDVLNNHIPLDASAPSVLRVVKTGSVRVVELGDSMEYSIGVAQWSGPPLSNVQVVDTLPAGFRYIPGTFRMGGTVQPDPTGGVGPVLNFRLPNLTAGATVNFSYRVRVGVGSMEGTGTNRARATAGTGAAQIASNQAEYTVRVEGGVFTNDGCVIGKVYVDCNGNHVQDAEELGIPGVRLYFDDGYFLVSDVEGKYSVCGRMPRTWVLKVDPTTLPRGSRLTTTSSRNVGDANSIFVDLKNGELQRADFAEGSCSNTVLEQVKARRSRGEVNAPEVERKGGPALKFLSRGLAAPKQATDSANQPVPAQRDPGGPPPRTPLENDNATPVPLLPAGIAPTVREEVRR